MSTFVEWLKFKWVKFLDLDSFHRYQYKQELDRGVSTQFVDTGVL